MAGYRKPPMWFWIVAVLLLVWNAYGCYQCYLQWTLGAEAMGTPTAYQRQLYAGLPGWYDWDYAIAVAAGLIGALLLLARSGFAHLLFVVSAIAVVVMFGYLFATTDIIAHMGFAAAAGLPIVILLVALIGVWLARRAATRGWIG